MRELSIKPAAFKFNFQNFGDKSITHRALILGALASGKTRIFNANFGDDCLATAKALMALGSKIEFFDDGQICVSGGAAADASGETALLYCDNSGTTARLLAGFVAARGPKASFFGDASLVRRPMDMLYYLSGMGAETELLASEMFTISPPKGGAPLKAIDCLIEKSSAQTKSAVIIAALKAEGVTRIRENAPTRDHTEKLARHMGANIFAKNGQIEVSKSVLTGAEINVPNDFSTAAFFIVLGLFKAGEGGLKLKNVGLNPTRIAFLELLMQIGAKVTVSNLRAECGEQRGDLTIFNCGGMLKNFELSAQKCAQMLDEIPIAAVLAAKIDGESKFLGLEGLKTKETNRIETIKKMLDALGCECRADGDTLTVAGTGKIAGTAAGNAAGGGEVCTHGDHRIAMSAVIGALLSQKGARIDDCGCINISCPNFLSILNLE